MSQMGCAQIPVSVPQTTKKTELCLRLTNGKPALAHWIGEDETKVG
jgi:hypothetical protein